jgi:hypothetical protein
MNLNFFHLHYLLYLHILLKVYKRAKFHCERRFGEEAASPAKIRAMMGSNMGLIGFRHMHAEEFSRVVGMCSMYIQI